MNYFLSFFLIILFNFLKECWKNSDSNNWRFLFFLNCYIITNIQGGNLVNIQMLKAKNTCCRQFSKITFIEVKSILCVCFAFQFFMKHSFDTIKCAQCCRFWSCMKDCPFTFQVKSEDRDTRYCRALKVWPKPAGLWSQKNWIWCSNMAAHSIPWKLLTGCVRWKTLHRFPHASVFLGP